MKLLTNTHFIDAPKMFGNGNMFMVFQYIVDAQAKQYMFQGDTTTKKLKISTTEISKELGVNRNTIAGFLNMLEDAGLLTLEKTRGGRITSCTVNHDAYATMIAGFKESCESGLENSDWRRYFDSGQFDKLKSLYPLNLANIEVKPAVNLNANFSCNNADSSQSNARFSCIEHTNDKLNANFSCVEFPEDKMNAKKFSIETDLTQLNANFSCVQCPDTCVETDLLQSNARKSCVEHYNSSINARNSCVDGSEDKPNAIFSCVETDLPQSSEKNLHTESSLLTPDGRIDCHRSALRYEEYMNSAWCNGIADSFKALMDAYPTPSELSEVICSQLATDDDKEFVDTFADSVFSDSPNIFDLLFLGTKTLSILLTRNKKMDITSTSEDAPLEDFIEAESNPLPGQIQSSDNECEDEDAEGYRKRRKRERLLDFNKLEVVELVGPQSQPEEPLARKEKQQYPYLPSTEVDRIVRNVDYATETPFRLFLYNLWGYLSDYVQRYEDADNESLVGEDYSTDDIIDDLAIDKEMVQREDFHRAFQDAYEYTLSQIEEGCVLLDDDEEIKLKFNKLQPRAVLMQSLEWERVNLSYKETLVIISNSKIRNVEAKAILSPVVPRTRAEIRKVSAKARRCVESLYNAQYDDSVYEGLTRIEKLAVFLMKEFMVENPNKEMDQAYVLRNGETLSKSDWRYMIAKAEKAGFTESDLLKALFTNHKPNEWGQLIVRPTMFWHEGLRAVNEAYGEESKFLEAFEAGYVEPEGLDEIG